MKINLPVLYDQGDGRWASKLLGFNTNPIYNFKNYGCLLCCEAATARYYGKNVDPVSLNDKLRSLGTGKGYTAGSGNYVWNAITKVFSDIKEKLVNTPMPLTDAQLGEIRSAIDNGTPVMLQIDYNPRTVANDMHFVLAIDYDTSDENNITIYDPIGGVTKSLKSYLGWYKPSVRKTIEKYIVLSGPVPAQAGNTVAVDAKVFPNLVHGSGEHDKSVAEYLPGNDPTKTNFTDIQRVVNGYKSDASASKTRLAETESKLEVANTEIINQREKVANVQDQCQRSIELKNAEITTLKQAQPNIDKLKTEYISKIDALENQLRTAQKQGGIKDLKIADLNAKIKACEAGEETLTALQRIIEYIKTIWKK